MLASKFFDDVYYNNAYYARVGGISNIEVTPHAYSLIPLLPACYSLLATPCLLLPACYSLLATADALLPTHYCTSYSLLPTHYFRRTTALLPTTHYCTTSYYSLLPTHYFLLQPSDHLTI